MSALVVPNVAEVTLLQGLVDALLDGGELRLFASNHTPVAADTLSTYSAIQASFGGYAGITLNSWSAVFLNGSDEAETDEIVRTFTASGSGLPQTIYGAYVVDSNGDLAYAELFQNAVTLSAAGHTVNFQPVFTGRSQN